jgi:hypothetical protein
LYSLESIHIILSSYWKIDYKENQRGTSLKIGKQPWVGLEEGYVLPMENVRSIDIYHLQDAISNRKTLLRGKTWKRVDLLELVGPPAILWKEYLDGFSTNFIRLSNELDMLFWK